MTLHYHYFIAYYCLLFCKTIDNSTFYFQPGLSLTYRHVCIRTFLLDYTNKLHDSTLYEILPDTSHTYTHIHTHIHTHTHTPSRTCIPSPVCLCKRAIRKSALYTRKRDLRFPKNPQKIVVNSQPTKRRP